jgi:hypothetical protein
MNKFVGGLLNIIGSLIGGVIGLWLLFLVIELFSDKKQFYRDIGNGKMWGEIILALVVAGICLAIAKKLKD